MLEEILQLLEERRLAELSRRLGELNPADIAATLEELPEKDLPPVFRILPKDKAADTFVELDIDIQELLIHAFSDKELKAVMDQLYMDDTVDIIEEMPANVVRRILAVTTPEDRAAINQLLSYPEDSAGSLMTVEYVSLPRQLSVDQAIHRIRRTAVDKETIYTCYVTDPNRKLIGVITVKELLTQPGDACISDIMEENVLFVTTHEDKEQVAQLFSKYDMLALPVLGEQFLNFCVGFYDVWLAGRLAAEIREPATSAVGVGAYVGWFASLMFSLVAAGTTALISRARGAGDFELANRVANRSMLLADAKTRHETLELWCFADNRRARRFYEAHGFAEVERTDGAAVAAIEPPADLDESGYAVHPAVLDAGIQAVAAALPEQLAGALYLPIGLENVWCAPGSNRPRRSVVRVDAAAADAPTISCTVTLYDMGGAPVVRIGMTPQT